MQEVNDLKSQITRILLKNASFYRASPSDSKLYYIDYHSVGAFAYQIIQYAANVFGAAVPLVTGALWARQRLLLRPRPDTKSVDIAQSRPDIPTSPEKDTEVSSEIPVSPERGAEVACGITELRSSLESLRESVKRTKELRGEMVSHFRETLEYHGWPTQAAIADAEAIVTALLREEVSSSGGPVTD